MVFRNLALGLILGAYGAAGVAGPLAPTPQALSVAADPMDLIQDEFEIPEVFRGRVAFWMDVYTRYDSQEILIHNAEKPEEIFEVINVRRFVKSGKSNSEIAKAQRAVIESAVTRWEARTKKKIRYQRGLRESFSEGLVRSEPYLLELERVFRDARLPPELTRLVFAESSFNPYSESCAGAKGVWQIMPAMARKLLIFDGGVDEREHPVRSAKAAAKLLKESYRATKSWPLTVTSYNQGLPAVLNIYKKWRRMQADAQELYKIISRHRTKTFKFAGQNYYWQFLAALYAERYRQALTGNRTEIYQAQL
jgi:membrane-bound lytic murein transglycosylase D